MFSQLAIIFNRLFFTESPSQDETRMSLDELMASFCTEPGCYELGYPELEGICVMHTLACPDDGCKDWKCDQRNDDPYGDDEFYGRYDYVEDEKPEVLNDPDGGGPVPSWYERNGEMVEGFGWRPYPHIPGESYDWP